MIRKAFKMKMFEGCEAEYEKRHKEIWPELEQLILDAGVYDYSIYLDKETLTLFGVLKLNNDNTDGELASHPIMRKWWDYMSDIMVTNDDNSPLCSDLTEVFHLKDCSKTA